MYHIRIDLTIRFDVQDPQIITVPQFYAPKRYWIVRFLDAYTNYFAGIGSTSNSSAGQYLVVGPGKHLPCLEKSYSFACLLSLFTM